eukprot:CAMPEP_0175134170 /NCGR_PEP_ID=MMETSP0087-20121206/8041_1 /TAXON_ID=136419 /ORGANISM="Unknown Unknown, Strain D1" /LENGTH=261 /DNA_ID=CAMNT_0016416725 /DNA_START=37 /DNA_END=822 /DNA_ORIENTATION=+
MEDPSKVCEGRFVQALRICSIAALAVFATGTACDNARLFTGHYPSEWPAGLFDIKNSTTATNMVKNGTLSQPALPAMADLAWFCFFAHEVLGGLFAFPVLYLWEVVRQVELKRRVPQAVDVLLRVCCGVSCVVILVGLTCFVKDTVNGGGLRRLEYNPSLQAWSLKSTTQNPLALIGVFYSSAVWIVVACLLCYARCNIWFLVVNLVCFFGQAASEAAGDYKLVSSNLLEQVALWSLLGVSYQYARVVSTVTVGFKNIDTQ